MVAHNQGKNKRKVYTTFITILQLSKGGVFCGSNKLKHLTSAMMKLDWKGAENSNQRFMEFSKNRIGQVGQKLYFNFQNGVTFDQARYTRDLLNEELLEEERKQLETEDGAFDKLFAGMANEMESDHAEENTY